MSENYVTDWDFLCRELREWCDEDVHWLSNLSNAAALLYEHVPGLNWAGFYLLQAPDGPLVLGPFQGKAACMRIALGNGVCGTSAKERRVERVADVHAYPGHIACDGASNAEIVLPLYSGEALVGVLDLDSPHLDRFSEEDERGLRAFVEVLRHTRPIGLAAKTALSL